MGEIYVEYEYWIAAFIQSRQHGNRDRFIVRNVNPAILIKASMFPATSPGADALGDIVLFTVRLYGGLQMLVAAVVITGRRRP